MKKFFFLMVALATFTITANAQDDDEDDKVVYVNPHVEIGYGHLSSNEGWANMTFGGLGCDVEFKTNRLLGISVGADFNGSMTGYRAWGEKFGDTYTGYRVKEKFNFLNFPILAQFHFGVLALKAGIQPQFLVTAKISYSGTEPAEWKGQKFPVPVNDQADFKKYYNTFSLAIPVGVSYTFSVPVTVDLRCNIPVTKLNKKWSTIDKDMVDVNQRYLTVMLSLGYRF